MEDKFNFFENGRRPQFFEKGRRPQIFENGKRPQKDNATKNNNIFDNGS
jgi:hypothetical protein